ncbi:MAG TPA: porin [Longimicrobiaceae bacterium]
MIRRPLMVMVAGAVLTFAGGSPADAQDTDVIIGSEAIEIDIGGRVQTQFNTTTIASEAPSEMILRRARIELDVTVNDLVSASIDPDFAGNEVTLKDVYAKLNFSPQFQLLVGQAYKPFGLLEQTSSTRILPIERGLRVRGLEAMDEYAILNELEYSDRDIGVQVMGEPDFLPLGFRYQAGIFRGPLHGASNIDDSYQYAARFTIQPSEIVRVGAGWSSRHFLDVPVNESDPFVRGHAFELDAEVGTYDPGLHLLGEISFGDANPSLGQDFFGAHGWVAWRSEEISPVVSAFEPIFRASYGDVDEAGETTLLTPGFNVYFGGRNRLMVNYDFVLLGDASDDTEGSFKMQMQVAF